MKRNAPPILLLAQVAVMLFWAAVLGGPFWYFLFNHGGTTTYSVTVFVGYMIYFMLGINLVLWMSKHKVLVWLTPYMPIEQRDDPES